MADFHSLQVSRIDRLTDQAVKVTLDIPNELADSFSFLPGQYITLDVVVGEEKFAGLIHYAVPQAFRGQLVWASRRFLMVKFLQCLIVKLKWVIPSSAWLPWVILPGRKKLREVPMLCSLAGVAVLLLYYPLPLQS